MKPEIKEKERTSLTVGKNLLDSTGNLSAPTASVTTEKCVFNSVVSTPGGRCLLGDIKHFYLNNILPDPEFMRIPLKITSQEIINTYDLKALVEDQGWIYMRIDKGMYGLKQAGIITNQELVKHMAPFEYYPVKHTPGPRVHNSKKTLFNLVVENFCVQYFSTEDADHFLNALRSKYFITVDMETTVYIGIKLAWDYVPRTVTLSMPSYVHKELHRFQNILRGVKEYSPHTCAPNPVWTGDPVCRPFGHIRVSLR